MTKFRRWDSWLRRYLAIGALACAAVFATCFASHGQTYGTVSIDIQFPAGTQSYAVPVTPGMTLEDAMKIASVMSPPFKWTAIWYGSLGAYLVVAFNDVKNDDASGKYWQFCGGPKGSPQTPSTRGVNLYGVAPNDKITWQYVNFGGLTCPSS